MSDNYVSEISEMKWSYSRLTAFEQCPYYFYLTYLLKDDELYLPEGNYYAEVGTFCHEILAKIFSGELSVDDAPLYYAENFNDNVFYKTRDTTMAKNYEACANYFAELQLDWLENYEIVGVEKKWEFTYKKRTFLGFIDLLLRDKRDGKLVIVDHKSGEYPLKKDGGVKKPMIEKFESYKRQMYLYAHAVYDEYGEWAKNLVWNHFKEGKHVSIPFNEKEYDDTMAWAMSIIDMIGKEEEFSGHDEYYFCHVLCEYRHSCEYCNTDFT